MTLAPIPGSYGRVMYAKGAGSDFSNEPMNEIDDTINGNPRYTVYEVTDVAKRYMKIDEVPVFEIQIHGAGGWSTITDIREIQYPGGRLVVNTALNSDDLVRVKTGHYMTNSIMYGTAVTKITDKNKMVDITCIGDDAKMQFPTLEEFNVSADIFYMGNVAELSTNMTGSNNDLTIEHKAGGATGNSISFEIVNPAGVHSLEVAVTGNDVVVTAAYATGAITSTAKQVIDALNSDGNFQRLGLVAKLKTGNDGTGIVTAFTHEHLAGGVDPENYYAQKGNLLTLQIYPKYSDDIRFEGYVWIESMDASPTPGEVHKQSISFAGHGKLYYRKA